MQTITYAGDEFLTGDDIADALLAYGRALGDENRAEIVEIPVRDGEGSIETARFLIGPASQIVTRPSHGADLGDEIEDPDLVHRLRELTRNVEAPAGMPLDEVPGGVEEIE
ncbi:hypothetical protein [Microbacterium sp. 179-I 3D3 NHS]|uniref:hypothetical protein n=1 Tax=unclassified Microbacterium TaxID=2609290 RepID=UPI0039A12358